MKGASYQWEKIDHKGETSDTDSDSYPWGAAAAYVSDKASIASDDTMDDGKGSANRSSSIDGDLVNCKLKILAKCFELPKSDLLQLLQLCNGSLQRATESLSLEGCFETSLDEVPIKYQEELLRLHTLFPWIRIGEILSLLHLHPTQQYLVEEILKDRSRAAIHLGFVEDVGTEAQFASRVSIRQDNASPGADNNQGQDRHVANGTICYRIGEQEYFGQFTTVLRRARSSSTTIEGTAAEIPGGSQTPQKKRRLYRNPPCLDADSSRWNDCASMFREAI